jgi:Lrp/AsnC family leucine-responsive transcriptional regulator
MLLLDDKAWRLLQALQHDGRAPLKRLAEAAGLSIPATAERLLRPKDAGVAHAAAAQFDAAAAGYGVRAMVGITVVGSINGYGETRTSIVFSTPIPRRGLVRPGSARTGPDLGQSKAP